MLNTKSIGRVVMLTMFMMFSLSVCAGTFTVTNTNDSGAGSLRQAILDVNAAGIGPHSIVFDAALSGGTISITSHLPVLTNADVTIDGDIDGNGTGDITIDATTGTGDVAIRIFSGDAGATNATFKGFTLQDMGYEAFRFDGSPVGVTIEDIVVLHTSGNNYINYGVYYAGNAVDFTVRNFTMTQKQNIANTGAIHFTGTTTNILIDNFDLSDSGGVALQAIRFSGVADTITIQNCDLDLDLTASTNDGDFGIYFVSNALDVTIADVNISNSDGYALYVAGTSTNIDITNFDYTNGDGDAGSYGIRFNGVANDITMANISLDLDHAGSTNDGNYGVVFNTTTTNVAIDGITVHDAEVHHFYIGGAATNISISNAIFDNFDGITNNQMVRFNTAASNITLTDVDISGDLAGTTDDAQYGIVFASTSNNTNITLTRVTIDEFDLDGIRFSDGDSVTIDDCTFSNCNSDGVEFIDNRVRTNNIIQNSTFDNNGRSGFVFNVANATTEFVFDNNTFSNTQGTGRGIWFSSTGGVKDIQVTNNTFFNNLGAAIYNEQADGVLYSQNSFYNNLIGIDNVANNGNNDLERLDGDVPGLISSVDVGSGNYDVTFTLPAFCTDCDVEFYTNQVGDEKFNGRTYTQVATGLSGVGPHTIAVSGGGATDGFWTTTLKHNTLNGSVSEFSKSMAINPKGPANVDAGIALWVRADISGQADGNFTVGNGWLDYSGNENHYEQAVASDPELVSNSINFNHSVVFDGNDYLNQLNIELNAFPTGNDDRTVFIVSKMTATSSETAFSYGRNATSQNQSWRYENGTMRYIGWGNDFTGAAAFTVNEAFIGRYDHNGTTASINSDGREISTSARTYNTNFSTGSSHIGTRITVAGEAFRGDISEVIVYNRNLTDAEKDRVESYLALKYGITLDQTIATDYFASDGTTKVWDATVNAAYTNDVTGIGRDDDGFFGQKQSKSINTDDILTIGLGEIAVDNPTNANTFASDKNFLVWGNDDGSTSTQTTELPGAAAALLRLGREWKVTETGSVNNLTLAFSGIPSTAFDIELFVDTDGDGDFSDASVITGGSVSNGIVTFLGVDLNNNDVFTLGYSQAAPGGVNANLTLWLRADDAPVGNMVNGIGWKDQSGNDNDFTAVASDPARVEGLNFNPYIDYDNGDYVAKASISSGYAAGEVFSMAKTSNAGSDGHAFSFGGNSNAHYNYTDNNSIYENFGNNDRYGWNTVTGAVLDAKAATTVNVSTPFALADWNTYNVRAGAGLFEAGFNGFTQVVSTNNTANFNADATNYLGRGDFNNWSGQQAELALFDRVLTTVERQQVNSYFAIKYGTTLDQSIATDYLASDGTVIWNGTANATYKNDISGIGRDDLSALNQKQSKSIHTDAIATIGLGEIAVTNDTNANTLAADKNFLIWGNDDASTDLQTTELPASAVAIQRLGREWKVAETGAVTNLTVSFANVSEIVQNLELYIDTDGDGDFSNATIITGGTAIDGEAIFTGVDLDDGDVFTLGYTLPAPGGETANLALWLRADTPSTTSSNWNDASVNSRNYDGGSVIINDANANFNPSLNTVGSYQKIGNNEEFLDVSFYAVFNNNGSGNSQRLFNNPANNNENVRLEQYNNSGRYGYTIATANDPASNVTNTINDWVIIQYSKAAASGVYDIKEISGTNGDKIGTISVGSARGIHIKGLGASASTDMAEMILYNSSASANNNRIESYLALKYGITLDQTSPVNYLASDATIIWNGTTNATYKNDITGMGRDDASALNQKQSKSVNDDALVTIGLGEIAVDNITNANTFAADKNFLVWGNDDGESELQTTELPGVATAEYRLGREWKVAETGSVSNLTITFDKVSSNAYDIELLVDTDGDGDFSNASVITGGTVMGSKITFTGIDLNDGDLFTLAYTAPFPGGVSADLQVWMRADMGVTGSSVVTTWEDQSTNNYVPTTVATPDFESNSLNFNPGVSIQGVSTDEYFNFGNIASGWTEAQGFIVTYQDNEDVTNGNETGHWRIGGSSNSHLTWTSETLYESFGNNSRIDNLPTPESTHIPHFYSASQSSSNQANLYWNGNNIHTSARTTYFPNQPVFLGRSNSTYRYLGDIQEFMLYDRVLTTVEQQRVDSYSALKYGITLDQTTPKNYLAADASILWNATTNAIYKNDITGIGRDDLSALNQKQSKSVNDDAIVTIGLGEIAVENSSNANTFASDKNFLIWGNDDASVSFKNTEIPVIGVGKVRVIREWKVAETGTVTNLTVSFTAATSPAATDFVLYVDTDGDGDFTNATVITGGAQSSSGVTFTGVDLNNNDVFTLGFTTPAPGGVITNLAHWFKADVGAFDDAAGTDPATIGDGIDFWQDQSPNGLDLVDRNIAPSYVLGNTTNNFRSTLDFGATNAELVNLTKATYDTNQDGSVFAIASQPTTSGYNSIVGYGITGTAQNPQLGTHNAETSIWDVQTGDYSPVEGVFVTNKQSLYDYSWSTTDATLGYDGKRASKGALHVTTTNTTQTSIGGDGNSSEDWEGHISEVAAYTDDLSAADLAKVQSYFAIKFGITLDQTAATDYVASDATILWNATANATYKNDITGIGRDDASALSQKQSKSVNDDVTVTIGLGSIEATNKANANTFTADLDFLIWGNDDVSTDLQTTELPSGAVAIYRLGREWKVAETGSVSNLTIAFDNVASLVTDIELYVDTDGDGDFTTGAISITSGTVVDDRAVFTGIDLDNNQVFTLGYTAPSPGGVITNLHLWLRADESVFSDLGVTLSSDSGNVEYWKDVTTAKIFDNSNNGGGTQSFNSTTKATNFNPAIEFDASGYLGRAFDAGLNSNDISIFTVDKPDDVTASALWSFNRHNNTSNNGGRTFYYSSATLMSIETPYPNTGSGGHLFDSYPNLATIGSIAIHGMVMTGSSTPAATDGAADYYFGGAKIETYSGNQSTAQQGVVGPYYLGARRSGTNAPNYYYDGAMSEHIRYTAVLTDAQVQRVNTYLSIKYGTTLDADTDYNTTAFEAPNGDGINEGDYVLSDGTTIAWDASANQTYYNDIAGIGRDDRSALNQKQSKSVNTDALVTIGLGSIEVDNSTNANTFATDKNFLIWGNDDASAELQSTELPGGASAVYRLGREWKVAETGGDVNNLTIVFDNIPSNAYDVELFVDTDGDGDFTNASVIAGGSISGGTVSFTGASFNDGNVFTLGYSLRSPGGVFVTETNGATYKVYNAYTVGPGIGTAPQMKGTLISSGYVANFTNVDDVFNNEISGVTGYEIETEIQIDVAGNYTFRQVIDNSGALWIDNVLEINNPCVCTSYSSVIALSVGRHKIKLRSANNGGPGNLNLQYMGPSIAWQNIPDNILFVPAEMGIWLKADAGITSGGDATTATVWEDQSANDNNVTTTEGTPLFYDTTESEMLNFNPSIDFQDDAMTSADNPIGLAFDKHSRTVFAVATSSTNSGSNYIFSQGRESSTSGHFAIRNNGGSLDLIGWGNDLNIAGYWVVDQPEIVTGLYENFNINGTNNATLYGKGKSLVQGNKNLRTLLNNNYDFSIGDIVDANQRFNGHITEVIYYPWDLDDTERSKVQSYLAIKYGIGLDQTVATNYIASDAAIIWDGTANAIYKNDITGIGYDDISALNQKQSKSVNTDALVTIGLGEIAATNIANTSTFSADMNFLVWGNDDASTAVINTGVPPGFSEKISRNWFIQETGAVGNTLVQIPNSAVIGFSSTTELVLVVADDAGFTTNVVTMPLVENGANWEVLHDFNGTKYFTFAIIAPNDFMRHGKHFQGGAEQKMKF